MTASAPAPARFKRLCIGAGVPLLAAAVFAVVQTWPLAAGLGRLARQDADAQFSIWNVAWVAHALTTDPVHVYDANIFYPHRDTLAYSENNLVAGVLAIPAWIATHNAYTAHNFVVVLAFTLSAAGMYFLASWLLNDPAAAAVAAVCFAFCPYVFSHMAHIQLLMTAGLPIVMLSFHRYADAPAAGRAALLGFAVAVQGLACGYYGVFGVLMVAAAAIVTALARLPAVPRGYWRGLAFAALVTAATVSAAFLPYVDIMRTGWSRTLSDARFYSPNWSAYLASSAYMHRWLLAIIPAWKNEVAFPGFVAIALAIVGVFGSLGQSRSAEPRATPPCRLPPRELVAVYGSVTLLALWASFGPTAGLYTALYKIFPLMHLLRAPGRFAIVVSLGISMLAGAGARWLANASRQPAAIWLLAALAAAELTTPLQFPLAAPFEPVDRAIAALPPGAVIEMPFFYPAVGLFQHTKYMVASTTHWKPLVNGYSDYLPPDFLANVDMLAAFPSRDAFKVLAKSRPRYAVFHLYGYNDANRRDVYARLAEFAPYLRLLYQDQASRVYEIIGFPP